jgi:hypothetical protein
MGYKAEALYLLNPAHFAQEIDGAIKDFYKLWLSRHSYENDKILYHYTDINGLKGIVTDRVFWSSHSRSFNDPEELQYGKDLVIQRLQYQLGNATDKNIIELLDDLTNFTESYDTIMYQNYITCFCENGNLLSQWRGYADSGGGYNIGVSINSDTAFYHSTDDLSISSSITLRKVIYDQEEQFVLVDKYLDMIVDAASKSIATNAKAGIPLSKTWATEAALQSVNILLDLLISFKNSAFQEEDEWRLIKVKQASSNPQTLHFRDGTSNLIPYLKTFMSNSHIDNTFPIKEITIGPQSEPNQAKAFIELYLHNSETSKSPIKLSAGGVVINPAGFRLR